MPVVQVLDKHNNPVGELSLPDEIFDVQVRPEILHQVIKAQLAAKRAGTVGVKTRSASRGGGRKPWRQKGTGRARAGSIRSPLWTGGAVTHGPQMRDYTLKVNKKVKRLAMRMALTSKLADNSLVVIDDMTLPSHKTKEFVSIQQALNLKKGLIVVSKKDNNLTLGARNVPGVKVIEGSQLGVYDILSYPRLVITPQVVEHLQERLQ
ncbi:MAG: 50S ribosomal protein L4 [Desulfovermiculus sp.]|nr:50S ribosomal protein L4 [Desulfovermiculus sp.]